MGLFSWFSGAGGRDSAKQGVARDRLERAYVAVEVVPCKGAACDAVQALVGQRFLAGDAPRFPLPGCDQSQCDCKYRRFDDRRASVRRISDLDIAAMSIPSGRQEERRQPTSPGRRHSDRRR